MERLVVVWREELVLFSVATVLAMVLAMVFVLVATASGLLGLFLPILLVAVLVQHLDLDLDFLLDVKEWVSFVGALEVFQVDLLSLLLLLLPQFVPLPQSQSLPLPSSDQ